MEENGRRFVVQRTLGQGSYGQVYLAEMVGAGGFKRRVALKLLRPGWEPSSDAARRIRDEARILGRLDHHNIVRVEDLIQLDGRWAIVMEYVAGVDLESLANERIAADRMLPVQACLEVAAAIADACVAAWDAEGDDQKAMRVIHRDIKPSNLRLSMTGTVKVLDFGVARADIDDRAAVTDGVRYGSIGYMAPERLHEEVESPSGDVYSIGVVIYELLTLQAWGRSDPRTDRHAAQLEAAAALVRSRGGAAADDVADLMLRCLAYEASERPSMEQLRDDARTLAMLAADGDLRSVARSISAAIPVGTDDEAGRVLVERTGAPRISGPTLVSGPGETTRSLDAPIAPTPAPQTGPVPPAPPPQRAMNLFTATALTFAVSALLFGLITPDPKVPTEGAGAEAKETQVAPGTSGNAPAPPPSAGATLGEPRPAPPPAAILPRAAEPASPAAKPSPQAVAPAPTTTSTDATNNRASAPAAAPTEPATPTKIAAPSSARLRSAKFTVNGDAPLTVRCGDRSGSGTGNVLLRDFPPGVCRVTAGSASTSVLVDSPRGVECTNTGGSLTCR